MIKEIVKDEEFLTQKSNYSIIREDKKLGIYQDLLDTANHYGVDKCLGLAAVQIGELKRVIAIWTGNKYEVFVNPLLVNKSKEVYEAEESCLSLEGSRKVIRHKSVTMLYTTLNGKNKKINASGLFAEIIQHEVDHCNGILI